MTNDELKAMFDGKSLFDFRTEQQFKNMDKDNSNTLTKEEVRNFVDGSIDGDVDQVHLEEDLKKWDELDLNKDGVFDLNEFRLIYKQMIQQQLNMPKSLRFSYAPEPENVDALVENISTEKKDLKKSQNLTVEKDSDDEDGAKK